MSLIKVADTQHGTYYVPGSCTRYLRDTDQFQPQDNLKKEVLSLIPFYGWEINIGKASPRLPWGTG